MHSSSEGSSSVSKGKQEESRRAIERTYGNASRSAARNYQKETAAGEPATATMAISDTAKSIYGKKDDRKGKVGGYRYRTDKRHLFLASQKGKKSKKGRTTAVGRGTGLKESGTDLAERSITFSQTRHKMGGPLPSSPRAPDADTIGNERPHNTLGVRKVNTG